jgi:hypothetical protein
MHHCYHCGAEIKDAIRSLAIIIIESHSGRLGSAHLHCHCCDRSLARYRQTVTWDGSTISNLTVFKRLHVASPR